jgi:hypothetical protein
MRPRIMTASLVALLGLAGCGGGGSSTEPTDRATSTPSSSASSAPSPAEDGTAGESASPSVAPASGPPLRMDTFRVNLPEGWERGPTSSRIGGGTAEGGSVISVLDFPAADATLDEMAREAIRSGRTGVRGARLERLPDFDLDGCAAYRVQGPGREGAYEAEVGCKHLDHDYRMTISLAPSVPRAGRQRLIESVLASWRFR